MKSAIGNRRRRNTRVAASIRTMMTTTTEPSTGLPKFTDEDIDLKSLSLRGKLRTTKPPAARGKAATLAVNPKPRKGYLEFREDDREVFRECGFDLDRFVPIDHYDNLDRFVSIDDDDDDDDDDWKSLSLGGDPTPTAAAANPKPPEQKMGFDLHDVDLKSLSLGGEENLNHNSSPNPNPNPPPQQQEEVVVNKWDEDEEAIAIRKKKRMEYIELMRKYGPDTCKCDSDSDDEPADSVWANKAAARYRDHKLIKAAFGFNLYHPSKYFHVSCCDV